MNNVVTFSRRPAHADIAADYWPKVGYGIVVQRLWENIPEERGATDYSYVIKPTLETSTCSVTVRRKGEDTVVLFNACEDVQDNNDLKAWFVLNDKRLRRLLPRAGKLTIVGKIGHQEGEKIFLIHYIIVDNEIVMDEVSIRKLMEPGDFGSAIYAVPCTNIVELTINKNTGGVSFPFMNNAAEGLTIIGIPVNVIIPRENGGAPVLKASLVHMRFMSFTHVTPKRALTLEPAA